MFVLAEARSKNLKTKFDSERNHSNYKKRGKSIKRDVLFKPILRCFRQYIKHRFETMTQIRLRTDTLSEIKKKVREFLRSLNSPASITEDADHKLLLMLFPIYCKKTFGSELGLQSMLKKDALENRELFYQIYKENNMSMRQRFF